MAHQTTLALRRTVDIFNRHHVAAPKGLVEGVAAIDALSAADLGLAPPTADDIADAIFAAVTAGRDLAGDKTIAKLLQQRQLSEIGSLPLIEAAQDRRARDLFHAFARPALDTCSQVVADLDAERLQPVHSLGIDPTRWFEENMTRRTKADHHTPLAHAREALDTIKEMLDAWIAVVTAGRMCKVDHHLRPLLLADLDLADLDRINLAVRNSGATGGRFVNGGHLAATAAVFSSNPLDLPTPENYTARINRVRVQVQQRDDTRSWSTVGAQTLVRLTGGAHAALTL